MRSLGLGGAYIGVAEGLEGAAFNPAAGAVRSDFSLTNLDYDLGASVYLPGAFAARTDFENRGTSGLNSVYDNFLIVNLGAMLQVGPWGLAAGADVQSFRVTETGRPDTSMQLVRYHIDLARGFFHDQLSIGVGVRAVSMLLAQGGGPAGSLLAMNGASPQAGVLVRPNGQRFRIGATFRGPVYGSSDGSQRTAVEGGTTRFFLPHQVVLPVEIEAGVAVQIGPRPLNPEWQSPADQEEPLDLRVEEARSEREKALQKELEAESPPSREVKRRALEARESAIRAIEDARLDAGRAALKEARRARYENTPRARIMVVASVLAIGPSDRSVAISGFLSQRYEPVGQSWTLTPRFGVESEPVTDRLVLRVGGYLEPARLGDGTPRQHLTFGGDVKLFTFDFFGLWPNTALKMALGVDLAPRYTNWGLGLGIWH